MKYILLFVVPFLTFCSSNEKMIDVKDLEGKWKVVDADLKLKSTWHYICILFKIKL